jgi:hypothetical protein
MLYPASLAGSELPKKSCVPIVHPLIPEQTLFPAPMPGELAWSVNAEVGMPVEWLVGLFNMGSATRLWVSCKLAVRYAVKLR